MAKEVQQPANLLTLADPELGTKQKRENRGKKEETKRGDPRHPGRGAPEADRPRAEPAGEGEPDKGRTGEGGK